MEYARDEEIALYSVKREKRASCFNMLDSHYHNHYEIYYLTKGSVRYFINDRIYDLGKGDAIVIPPGVVHKTATLENRGAERLVIAFTNEFIRHMKNDRIFGCFSEMYFKNAPIEKAVRDAEKEFLTGDSYSEELILGYIIEIITVLTRISDEKKPKELSHNREIIEAAVNYINDNYASELSLYSLAKSFALSESHFSRQFKLFTGFGVSEYITFVRIKNAERILLSSTASVTETAARCGFNSSSYFTAVFRKYRKITPGKMRRHCEDN